MSLLAVITARGGSKRIPRKNIKDFCGKPILVYSIEAALQSALFDEVMVSTDDKEIASVAREYGAAVPFLRSAATSDDFATTSDALREVLQEYQKLSRSFDYMCCLYPTAPFITSAKLVEAWHAFASSGADCLTPVVKFSYPPQRCFVLTDGCLHYKWPEFARMRSQDLEPFYHDAGQFYFWKVGSFLNGSVQKTIPYIISDMDVQDIDTLEDWRMAQFKYEIFTAHSGGGRRLTVIHINSLQCIAAREAA